MVFIRSPGERQKLGHVTLLTIIARQLFIGTILSYVVTPYSQQIDTCLVFSGDAAELQCFAANFFVCCVNRESSQLVVQASKVDSYTTTVVTLVNSSPYLTIHF